jgi:hypothetical protein
MRPGTLEVSREERVADEDLENVQRGTARRRTVLMVASFSSSKLAMRERRLLSSPPS